MTEPVRVGRPCPRCKGFVALMPVLGQREPEARCLMCGETASAREAEREQVAS